MGKTYRDIPKSKWNRTPHHKGKVNEGGKKQTFTDWDEQPISGRKENKWRFN